MRGHGNTGQDLICVLIHQYTYSVHFDIHPNSAEPIYRQIVAQVRRQVASGLWPTGTLLPSVRALAQQHAINPMTVSKAYSLLEAEGLLERRRGTGMLIAERQIASHPTYRLALLEPALRSAAQQAGQLGIGPKDALDLFARLLAEHRPTAPPGPAHTPVRPIPGLSSGSADLQDPRIRIRIHQEGRHDPR